MRAKLFLLVYLVWLFVLAYRADAQHLYSQVLYPQENRVGPYQEFVLDLCNNDQSPLQVTPSLIWQSAARLGVVPATYQNLVSAARTARRRSTLNILLRSVQYGSTAFSAVVASGLVEVNNARVRVPLSVVGLGLSVAMDVMGREAAPDQPIPTEGQLFPAPHYLGPGECRWYTVYGKGR